MDRQCIQSGYAQCRMKEKRIFFGSRVCVIFITLLESMCNTNLKMCARCKCAMYSKD